MAPRELGKVLLLDTEYMRMFSEKERDKPLLGFVVEYVCSTAFPRACVCHNSCIKCDKEEVSSFVTPDRKLVTIFFLHVDVSHVPGS